MPSSITMPAEWQAQSAVLLAWPHEETDWAPILKQVETAFVQMASEISLRQAVLIICMDTEHQQHIHKLLSAQNSNLAEIYYAAIPYNDTWARDFGPISVTEKNTLRLLNFRFNAWGNKYESSLDDAINTQLFEQCFFKPPLETIPFILEGGSIESDGQGTILTSTTCLLSHERNPDYSKADLERQLGKLLGTKRILWLDHGSLAGDDTDNHVDNLARFVAVDSIAYVKCDDPQDDHYQELRKMEVELKAFLTGDNKPYHLIPLPLPKAHFNVEGRRLPASYANFLIINQAVLVPAFDQASDEVAQQTLKTCFPDRDIIAIDCRAITEQNGGVHCLTMQLPEGVFNPAQNNV